MKKLIHTFTIILFTITLAYSADEQNVITVMTYNIHHAEGVDGEINTERIAKLIRDKKCDLVAVQEVDRGVQRTNQRDIPKEIAKKTGMHFIFGKNIDYQGGDYGNAILSKWPIAEWRNHHYKMLREGEQRGLLIAEFKQNAPNLVFMSTHLDYRKENAERLSNVSEMISIAKSYNDRLVIIAGDFNDFPQSKVWYKMSDFFSDVWPMAGKGKGFTFSSTKPRSRIDYIWINKPDHAKPVKCEIPQSQASDHLPLMVKLKLE